MAQLAGLIPAWLEPLMEYIRTVIESKNAQDVELADLYDKTCVQEARIRDLTARISTRDAKIAELERKLNGGDDEQDDLSSDDDIASVDTRTALANELTEANHALMHAQDEVERLTAVVAQREEEIVALEEENEELVNSGPYERAERLKVLAKVAAEMPIETPIDILNEHNCFICLNNTDGPFIRTIQCNVDHGVCFKCFAHLMNSSAKARCPICTIEWEEGNLLIE